MEYDIDKNESVGEAVVFAVSSAKECDPLTLRSLNEVVDPDALNELSSGKTRIGAQVSFIYSDHRIIIDNGECVTIQPLNGLQVQ